MPASRYSLGGTTAQSEELTLPSRENPADPNSPHNVCLVRRIGPSELLSAGLLDRLDGLSAIVQMAHLEPKGIVRSPKKAPKQRKAAGEAPAAATDEGLRVMQQIQEQMGSLDSALDLMDRVVEMALVEPAAIRPVVRDELGQPVKRMVDGQNVEVPLPATERVQGQWYTDMVDMADKAAIMAFAMGGVKELESFRG